jgi:hypothetical protein
MPKHARPIPMQPPWHLDDMDEARQEVWMRVTRSAQMLDVHPMVDSQWERHFAERMDIFNISLGNRCVIGIIAREDLIKVRERLGMRPSDILDFREAVGVLGRTKGRAAVPEDCDQNWEAYYGFCPNEGRDTPHDSVDDEWRLLHEAWAWVILWRLNGHDIEQTRDQMATLGATTWKLYCNYW